MHRRAVCHRPIARAAGTVPGHGGQRTLPQGWPLLLARSAPCAAAFRVEEEEEEEEKEEDVAQDAKTLGQDPALAPCLCAATGKQHPPS